MTDSVGSGPSSVLPVTNRRIPALDGENGRGLPEIGYFDPK